jgi:hypothetical protein
MFLITWSSIITLTTTLTGPFTAPPSYTPSFNPDDGTYPLFSSVVEQPAITKTNPIHKTILNEINLFIVSL